EVAVEIINTFREAGIEMPFPQRDLHVRGGNASPQQALPGTDEQPGHLAGDSTQAQNNPRL
ncbi:MAG TPA: hypothetical protein VLE20_03125, partial [Blastocatellia bacterium]|nr:hypothetical protein [Blastocatellia bacterium]